MISLVECSTSGAQEPMCVPFLRGSASLEGLEPIISSKDALVRRLLGVLLQRVSKFCLVGHRL